MWVLQPTVWFAALQTTMCTAQRRFNPKTTVSTMQRIMQLASTFTGGSGFVLPNLVWIQEQRNAACGVAKLSILIQRPMKFIGVCSAATLQLWYKGVYSAPNHTVGRKASNHGNRSGWHRRANRSGHSKICFKCQANRSGRSEFCRRRYGNNSGHSKNCPDVWKNEPVVNSAGSRRESKLVFRTDEPTIFTTMVKPRMTNVTPGPASFAARPTPWPVKNLTRSPKRKSEMNFCESESHGGIPCMQRSGESITR